MFKASATLCRGSCTKVKHHAKLGRMKFSLFWNQSNQAQLNFSDHGNVKEKLDSSNLN